MPQPTVIARTDLNDSSMINICRGLRVLRRARLMDEGAFPRSPERRAARADQSSPPRPYSRAGSAVPDEARSSGLDGRPGSRAPARGFLSPSFPAVQP